MRRIRNWVRWSNAAPLLDGFVAMPSAALADFKVTLPDAEPGEFEFETVGTYGRSGNPPTTTSRALSTRSNTALPICGTPTSNSRPAAIRGPAITSSSSS